MGNHAYNQSMKQGLYFSVIMVFSDDLKIAFVAYIISIMKYVIQQMQGSLLVSFYPCSVLVLFIGRPFHMKSIYMKKRYL